MDDADLRQSETVVELFKCFSAFINTFECYIAITSDGNCKLRSTVKPWLSSKQRRI